MMLLKTNKTQGLYFKMQSCMNGKWLSIFLRRKRKWHARYEKEMVLRK